MARPKRDWLPQLGAASWAAFVDAGWRRTQVSEVAERLKAAVGTIYREVESKEALFELAVLHALDRIVEDERRPMRARPFEELVALIDEDVRRRFRWPVLATALRSEGDGTETAAVLEELYDLVAREHRLIRLLDRCAWDPPALADIHMDRIKGRYAKDFTRYVSRRLRGETRVSAESAAAARCVMEAVVWMAMHRRFDRLPAAGDEAVARRETVRVLCCGLAPPLSSRGRRPSEPA